MHAIEKHKENGVALAPTEWEALREQAQTLVKSGFLPKAIDTAEKAIAIALTGRELGLPMMQALRSVNVIEGKPTMSADLMAALVHKRIPGALLRVAETTNECCVVHAARPGQEPTIYEFTLADAKAAELLGKGNWKKYPRAMLRARCLAEAVRGTFPDACLGAYDPDELGAETTPEGTIVVQGESAPLPRISPHYQDDAGKQYEDPPELLELHRDAGTMAELLEANRIYQELFNADRASSKYQGEIGKAFHKKKRELEKAQKKHVEQPKPGDADMTPDEDL